MRIGFVRSRLKWSWLSLWTQNPRVHSPVVRAADCRSGGPLVQFRAETLDPNSLAYSEEQHYEPNHNHNHNANNNDSKKVS